LGRGGEQEEEEVGAGGGEANSSSVRVRNYNGAIHHRAATDPSCRSARERETLFEYPADVYLYISA